VPELADVFRLHGPAYRAGHKGSLLPSQAAAMDAIETCRTEACGGHVYICGECGGLRYSYHSCGNRHCPKCQHELASLWLGRQTGQLLPVPYCLITFTLPQELRAVARLHQKLVYGALFRESAAALLELARDPRHLGADLGFTGVLHTWTRDLQYHPHVHYVAPAGGLAPDGSRWIPQKYRGWLLPVRALGSLFRGKLRHALRRAGLLGEAPAAVWRKPWVVHIKAAGTGEAAFKYLAPYVYRAAVSNSRIVALDQGRVTYRYRRSDTGAEALMTLAADEFIRRLLQHVLPRGFVRVRSYGFYSSRRRDDLALVRGLLGADEPVPDDSEPPADQSGAGCGQSLLRCPHCGGPLILLLKLPPRKRAPP